MAESTDFFSKSNLTSDIDLPATKRYLYYVLKDKLSVPRDINRGDTMRSYTILGPRRVGKTIVLRQLHEHFASISQYIDCAELDAATDFEMLFQQTHNAGVQILLLDEISKISEDRVVAFTEAVKNFCWCTSFVLTGSTKSAVSKLSDKIGRSADVFELPPILYVERLAWNSDTDVFNYMEYRDTVTLESFRHYVQYFAVKPEDSALAYVQSVVDDTMESVLRHNYMDEDGIDTLKLSDTTREMILKYISLCQLVYAFEGETYCTIPSLSDHVQKTMGNLYQTIKGRQGISKVAIAHMCQLLLDSGLAAEMYVKYDALNDEHFRYHRVDKDVPNIIFEYPWYASIAIADVLDAQEMWGFWVENLLYMKMHYAYKFVDKYRFNNDEIDIVYTSNFESYYGLECKFRHRDHITAKIIERYQGVARRFGLSCIDITCTDDGTPYDDYTKFYKIHELIAALELGYIHLAGDEHIALSVADLMKQYGFLSV